MKLHVVLMNALILPSVADAQGSTPGTGRVLQMAYHEDEVVSVIGRMGYALDVELQAGERVINIAAGNLSALELGVEAQHVFVKPKRPIDHTNIVVLTDRRIYRMDYRAQPEHGADHGEIVHAIVFQFPPPPTAPAAVVAAAPQPVWNADYWYCGAPELRPSEAFDDGTRTYLRFAAGTEFPAAYVTDSVGQERLVNAHAAGDWIVVHETPRRIALRRGTHVGCIENRSTVHKRSAAVARPVDSLEKLP